MKNIMLSIFLFVFSMLTCFCTVPPNKGNTQITKHVPPFTDTPKLETLNTSNAPTTLERIINISAKVQFTNIQIKSSNNNDGEDLHLELSGIHVINKSTAFLAGKFWSYRSVLLRSNDGGFSWQEVMVPRKDSYISSVVFIGSGEGWALMEEPNEGGTITFFHTTDYGLSWEEINQMPRGRATVEGYEFIDSKHGRMIQTFSVGSPADSLYIYTTSDGGHTWDLSFVQSLPINDFTNDIKNEQFLQILSAYFPIDAAQYFGSDWGGRHMQTHPPDKYIIGHDGSAWLLDKQNSDEPYLIRIKALDETKWTTYTIPEYYKYEDGIVVLP